MTAGIQIKATDSRMGRFTVQDKILRDSINNGLAARLFYGCVPLDVRRDWLHEKSTFTLWHPSFDAIEQHAHIPEYIVVVENGSISWERVEDNAGTAAPFGQEQWDKFWKAQRETKQGGAA